MSKSDERILPDRPEFRPLERFWPYAELSEQPSDEELAALHPELRDVLFGARTLPFSITVDFPWFARDTYARAVELAKASHEYVETGAGEHARHRARFYPADGSLALRDLYDLVGDVVGTDVLLDDKLVPYARELWLPLVWYLIR